MNRFIKLLGAMFAVVAATTACDSITETDDSGTVDLSRVDLTVTVPLSAAQKVSSGYSTETLAGSYDLRVVVEAYDIDNSSVAEDHQIAYISESSLSSSSSVELVLSVPSAECDVLVWCDYVKAGDHSDLAYSAEDLRGVVATSSTFSVEANCLRRAFAGYKYINLRSFDSKLRGTSATSVSVVSVVGAYVLTDNSISNATDYKSLVSYSSTYPTGFNVKSGYVNSTTSNLSFYSNITKVDSDTVVAYDYILIDDASRTDDDSADANKFTVDLTATVYDATGTQSLSVVKSIEVTSEEDADSPAVAAL